MSFDISSPLTTATVLLTDTPMTFSCLINPDTVNIWRGLFYIGEAGGDQYYCMTMQAGLIKAYTRAGGATPIATSTVAAVADGSWQHAAVTFTSNISRAAFYNGGNKGTDSGNADPDEGQFNLTSIGYFSGHYNGKMAEVGVWNATLEDEEMAELGPVGGFVSPTNIRPESLVCYVSGISGSKQDIVSKLIFGEATLSHPHPPVFYMTPPSINIPGGDGTVEKYGPRSQVI